MCKALSPLKWQAENLDSTAQSLRSHIGKMGANWGSFDGKKQRRNPGNSSEETFLVRSLRGLMESKDRILNSFLGIVRLNWKAVSNGHSSPFVSQDHMRKFTSPGKSVAFPLLSSFLCSFRVSPVLPHSSWLLYDP